MSFNFEWVAFSSWFSQKRRLGAIVEEKSQVRVRQTSKTGKWGISYAQFWSQQVAFLILTESLHLK